MSFYNEPMFNPDQAVMYICVMNYGEYKEMDMFTKIKCPNPTNQLQPILQHKTLRGYSRADLLTFI